MTPKNHKMWRMSQREDKVLKKEGKTRKIVQDIKDQTISILEVFNPRGFVKYELTDEIFELKLGMEKDHLLSYDLLSS